jgi:hypothetical protein
MTHSAPVDDSIWPALARVLGRETVMKLRQELGGLEIKVPGHVKALGEEHVLVTALGRDTAELMVREFAGEEFYVRQDNRKAERRLLRAMDEGLSNHEIARAFGVSERHVRHQFKLMGIRNPNRRQTPRERARGALMEEEIRSIAAQ